MGGVGWDRGGISQFPAPEPLMPDNESARWRCLCMTCLEGEVIHLTLSEALINDLLCASYNDLFC